MSVYTSSSLLANIGHVTQTEIDLYGSSRLGVYNTSTDVEIISSNPVSIFTRGNKFFELTNHLGNVLSTISDKKIPVDENGDNYIDYYNPDIVTANDYALFGAQLPGRTFAQSNSSYRYGFNAKENDADVEGEGNQYDYGFRIYDPRLGHFLSVDPLSQSYPYYTPYQFAGNMPIAAIDLDGLEQKVVTYYKDQNNNITKIEVRAIYDNQGHLQNQHVHKIGNRENIAKNNVLVFESKRILNKKEQLRIIEDRAELNSQEQAIFDKNKMPEQESGKEQSLDYPQTGKTQYSSRTFLNAETISYDAEFGLAPPPKSNGDKIIPNPPPSPPNIKTVEKSYDSKIKYDGNTDDPYGDFSTEMGHVNATVIGSNIIDYKIVINGNVNGILWQDFKSHTWGLPKKYKNLGELAIARANRIKKMLVARGLDPAKIVTQLGDPKKGINADYKIITKEQP